MDPRNTLNRAYAHWLQDGISEIFLGMMLTGVGTLRAIIHFAEDKSATYYWLSGGLFVFMIGMAWGGKYFGEALKGRITYPRIGYFAFKPFKFNVKNILAFLALLVCGGIIGGLVGVLASQPNQHTSGVFVPIVMGIVWGLASTYVAHRVELKRLYVLAAFFFVVGLVIGALNVGVVLGVSFFYLSIGLVMLVSGGVALVKFLRSHEPVDLNGESQ